MSLKNQILFSLKVSFILMILIKLSGCSEEPPVSPDGDAKFNLRVMWDVKSDQSEFEKVKNAKVIMASEYGIMIRYTDDDGFLVIDNLPAGTYDISISASLENDNITLTGIMENINILAGRTYSDTIYVKPFFDKGIVINELYYAGPVNNFNFYLDQFIELYNSSDSVKYLDGCLLMKMKDSKIGQGADEDNDGDIDSILYIYKFPGNPGEKNIPILSGSFKVIAMDAFDHSTRSKNAINLENADWEFYNQYSPDDIDKGDVPNLENLRPESTKDFVMTLNVGVIILSNGRDTEYKDGIDIKTILDGVEYEFDLNQNKTLDSRVDKGHTLSPPKYSGKSIQRREPGYDTNNALNDWQIIDHPTPGYQ